MEFAREEDLQELLSFYREVIDAVNKTQVRLGWNIREYPNESFLQEEIEAGQMVILRKDGKIAAAAAVNHLVNEEYHQIAWKIKEPDERIATIHALAVSVTERGGKISGIFLDEIENFCRSRGDLAIHLDVIDTNIPAYKLYQRRGYWEADCIPMYYESVGTRTFWMMEKVLTEQKR